MLAHALASIAADADLELAEVVARTAAIVAWAAADGTPDAQLQADLAQAEAALKTVTLPAQVVFDRAVMTASRQWVATINPAATQAAVAIDAPRFPLAGSFDDVMSALMALYTEDHQYGTVVIDSLDWLERLIWAEVVQRKPTTEKGRPVTSIEDYGFAKGYTYALDPWKEVLDGLTALRDDRGMMVILIAHAKIERFENPETDAYRYYVCLHAQKRGYDTCPAPSVPAEELERFVVDQIRVIGRDSSLLATSLAEIARRAEEEAHHLNQEARLLTGHIHAAYGELSQVSVRPGSQDRTAKIQTEIDKHQSRLAEIRRTLDSLATTRIDRNDVKRVFSMFDPLWNAMSPLDQSHLLRLLIERIDYDGQSGEIELHLHPAGIRSLVDQHANDGETP